MAIVKIRTNRQITIPKRIFDELGLREGDFIQISVEGSRIVLLPKRLVDLLVDLEDALSPEEEELVSQGFEELKRGQYVTWTELRDELGV